MESMNKSKSKNRIVHYILFVLILLISLYLLQRLLIPKFVHGIVEGSLIEEYYDEEVKDHDIIFIGDCEVYESFSPITLWEYYGITSYIRGSAQQLIWQSYYLLEETLKYEIPDIAVFNVLSMKYDEPQNEAYNRMSLDGMKMSSSKIDSIIASMMEEESMIDYLVPLFRYHSRWSELEEDDFKYMFYKDQLFHNGYYMRADIRPVTSIPKAKRLADYEFGENSYYYLDLMVELCKENGIDFVLIKVPSLYPHWYDEWDQQMIEYAEKHDLLYINYLDLVDEVGIDFDLDTYDAGLHLNVYGAEKLSNHFGRIMVENFNLEDRRVDEELCEIWDEKIEFYNSMKERQLQELEEFGYIKGLGNNPR